MKKSSQSWSTFWPDDLGLLGDEPQQRLQGPALLDVAQPVEGRQQLVEAVGADRGHRTSPPLVVTVRSPGSSSTASSAGTRPPPAPRLRAPAIGACSRTPGRRRAPVL